MPEMTTYAQGAPCWVDLAVPDVGQAKEFYREVFGWDYVESSPEMGGYTLAQLNGKNVAGLFTPDPDANIPVVWTVYLTVDDANATAKAVTEHGGQLAMPVMDVGEEGTMFVAIDPTGAAIGAWQFGTHRGADLANEPGTFVWNELATRDAAAARSFYAEVFGVEISDPMSDEFDYATIKVDGRDVAGIWQADANALPDGMPPFWFTYFGTSDTDKTANAVTSAGGSIVREPKDSPYGRMATFQDSQGGIFSVVSVSS